MIFCHYCYNEITVKDFVSKDDGSAFYHIECFAEMNEVELKEDEFEDTK